MQPWRPAGAAAGPDRWRRSAGHPTGARDTKSAQSAEDKIESAYRFLLADLMPFGKNARICLEHGGTNESTEHYQTATYWYGAPAPSLVVTMPPSGRMMTLISPIFLPELSYVTIVPFYPNHTERKWKNAKSLVRA